MAPFHVKKKGIYKEIGTVVFMIIKKNYSKYLYPIIMIALFFFMILNMILSTEQAAGVPREMYFSQGLIFFTIMIFILRRVSWKNFAVWGIIIIGVIGLAVYYYINGINWISYGHHGFRLVAYRHLYIVFAIALFVETIMRWKKNGIPRNWDYPLVSIFTIGVIIAGIMDHSTMIPLLYVSVSLLMTDIERDEWIKLVDYFAIGYYLVFVLMMTLSLTVYSDNIQAGRLIGAFLQVETAGMFCAGAFLCAIYYVVKQYIYDDSRNLKNLIIGIILSIYPVYALFVISSRSTFIGAFFTLLGMFVFLHGKRRKNVTVIRGGIASLSIILSLLVIVVVSLHVHEKFTYEEVNTMNHWYSYMLAKLYASVDSATWEKYGFKSPIASLFNVFSSGRLRIAVDSLNQIGLIGKPYETIYIYGGREPVYTPHNFYILALVNYGWIGGGLIIIWFIYYLVLAAKRSLNCNKTVILTAFWIFFCMPNFFFTCETWASPVYFGLLFLQYPLMRYKRNETVE